MKSTEGNSKNVVICKATKRDGKPCTRPALQGEIYCWQHSRKRRWIAIGGSILAGFVLYSTVVVNAFGIKSIFFPTKTPTPTQTFTVTPSPTITLTPTPKPLSDSLYYMIVYDSSLKMNESFHGQEKWQVARNLLVDIINGLNPQAQYGFMAIGGSDPSNNNVPCDSPTSLTLPFTARPIAYDFLGTLHPQGGGSFYKAYTLAKNQLESLPEDTIRTLIYITGTSDSCESHDEWTALKNLVSIPDSTFGIFSQIIILDDDGIRAQTLADQFNSLSNDNIDAKAPQSVLEIQGNGVTTIRIINNMTDYVNVVIESRATDAPIVNVPSITPHSSANFTPPAPTITAYLSPVPTFTTIPPLPPTAIPSTSVPTEAIAWEFTSSDSLYGVKRIYGSGEHYQVFEIATNRLILTTKAKFETANDVKYPPGFGNGKFAAAYHYGDGGGYTWIGVWDMGTGQFLYAWEKPELTTDLSGVFNGPP